MNTGYRFPARTVGLIFFICLVFFGCAASYYSNVGQTAAEEHIIPVEEVQGTGTQEWQTNDLRIVYDIDPVGETFAVAGFLYFDSYIINSFPVAERFRLYINYLDAGGTALQTSDISPLIGYRNVVPDKLKLPDAPQAPPGTAGFTFSYLGTFTGGNRADDNSGDWMIDFDPFR